MTAALEERYDGPTEEKRGYTYIPWVESVNAANEVFGIESYDVEVRQVKREGEGYMAIVRVTVHPADGASFYRDGVGYNEVQTTAKGDEMVDTAIKGAVSDALNRALKLFGKRFGLYLYEKAHATGSSAPTTSSKTGSSSGKVGKGARPSEKQLGVLTRAGFTEEQVEGMDFKDWKACVDAIFAKEDPPVAPAGKSKAAAKPTRKVEVADEDIESMFGD
jgi:hypothetical protein